MIGLTALALCLLLAACGGEQRVYGQVTERTSGEDGRLASFVVRTEQGKQVGFLVTGETGVFGWVDDVTEDDFLSGNFDGIRVFVFYDSPRRSLTTAAGEKIAAYDARLVDVNEVLFRNAAALSDGTWLDLWDGGPYASYVLPDGTELLQERRPAGPENVHVVSLDGYGDLSEAAQARVSAYYAEQGLLYDLGAELERAYAAYRADGGADFNSYTVGQDVSPSASSGQVMYFVTTVTLPIDGYTVTEFQRGAAFDRDTGESLDTGSLFTCDGDTLKRTLLHDTEPGLRPEMEAAFDPAFLVFFPDHLQLSFPEGSLPSHESSYLLSLEYDEQLRGILRDWAIPDSRET